MAIDQVSESVQRQERPIFSLKDFKNLSLNDQDALLEREFNQSMLIRGPSSPIKQQQHQKSSATSSLWPPLKSARYCKKQRQRIGKTRAFTPSIMLMHESSINHHRVASALNELSTNGASSSLFEQSNYHRSPSPFWSKKRSNCQEFWDEYLECDEEFSKASQEFAMLSLTPSGCVNEENSCPRVCYTKITKSIRKLLKRTFTGAPTFAELEGLVMSLIKQESNNQFKFSCGQVLNLSDLGATVQLDTPFHRVWLHAICQYHGLSSKSKTVHEDRLVFINFRSKRTDKESPKINLYNFLLQI